MTRRTQSVARAPGVDPGEFARRHGWRRAGLVLAGALLMCGAAACAPTGPVDPNTLPPSVQDPTAIKTPAGALGFYRTVVASLSRPIDNLVPLVGFLTDELAGPPMAFGTSDPSITALDSRYPDQQEFGFSYGDPYASLHRIRGQAREARGFLSAYLPDTLPALRGQLYALEGYADVWLADVYCSGIPLSTVDFDADYTLAAGSTTAEVYTAAVGLFDSALALTGDSIRLQQFAAVGRGRALLALHRYADAAAAVAAVPTGFRYEVLYDYQAPSLLSRIASTGDQEGTNGLDYRSGGDPRTPAVTLDERDPYGNLVRRYFPAKYPTAGPVTYVIADGIEARLIEAEAALAADMDWLTILNTLRTDGSYDTQPNANDPNQTDTLWHAGTGGVAGLRPLEDPVDPGARVDLVFRERAFWLYLTAHRQGDLRRLIRQYQRGPEAVYPTGSYPGGTGLYGDAVTVPVPEVEKQYNPNYAGCTDRNA